MSWGEPNYLHELERAESRDAQRFDNHPCGDHQHHYTPNTHGGGTCTDCGDELDRDEL